MAALADEEKLLTELFQYRFQAGDGLSGHSFGNLFLTAMTEITGDIEKAIAASDSTSQREASKTVSTTKKFFLCGVSIDSTSQREARKQTNYAKLTFEQKVSIDSTSQREARTPWELETLGTFEVSIDSTSQREARTTG